MNLENSVYFKTMIDQFKLSWGLLAVLSLSLVLAWCLFVYVC